LWDVALVLPSESIGGQVLAQDAAAFRCEITPERDHVVVRPVGELDMATIGAVEQELRHLRGAGFRTLVLDLSGLTFMDSTGLHLVMRWTAEAAQDGFTFEIEPGPPNVQRVFALAEMTHGLPFRREE
jgi:anti-sigma B factor antagonist